MSLRGLQKRQSYDFNIKMVTRNQQLISSSNHNKIMNFNEQISQTFVKINDTIDNLDEKVNKILEKHQAEFLYAWRSHIQKIKKQLYEIKSKADQKQKIANSNQRVIAIEKQMALFRDQALKLYQQVDQKKTQIQLMRKIIKQKNQEVDKLREQNKDLLKNFKITEAKSILLNDQIGKLESELTNLKNKNLSLLTPNQKKLGLFSKQNFIKTPSKTIGIQKLSNLNQDFINQLSSQSKHSFSINKINDQSSLISKINNHKRNKNQLTFDLSLTHKHSFTKNNPLQIRKKSLRQRTINNFNSQSTNLYENELKNLFLDCIKSIKKQISLRKTGFKSITSQIMKIDSLQEFKTIDKLKLLEMFLENQKLIVYMYEKIFPDRIKEVEEYFRASKSEKQIIDDYQIQKYPQSKNQSKHIDNQQMLQILDDLNVLTPVKQKIRVKSMSKGTRSQPIKNRIMVKDGKLNIMF